MNLNYAPLLIAAILGGWAIADHIHQKAPRRAAVLGGVAVLFVIAGVPALLALAKRPLHPGLVLVIALAVLVGSLALIWHDIIKGHHKDPLFGRKGKKAHHYRPQWATAALAVAAVVIAANWGAVWGGLGHAPGQMWSNITTHKPGS